MFATPDQIIDATCKAFSDLSSGIGYRERASAWLPVVREDVLTTCKDGCPMPVSQCRIMCIYIIMQHGIIDGRKMTFECVGEIFGKRRGRTRNSMLRACEMLSVPVFSAIYARALADIRLQGLWLWRAPQHMDCDAA